MKFTLSKNTKIIVLFLILIILLLIFIYLDKNSNHNKNKEALSSTNNNIIFSLITDHELDMLIDALDDKIHTCDEWCSDFICYNYEATSCKTWYCENLFLKEKKNIKYCSKCRGLAY